MIPNGQQTVFQSDRFGHAVGHNPEYLLRIHRQAVGASVIMFDVFNADPTKLLRFSRIEPLTVTDTAVTGVLGVRLILARTSAVGTGGTDVTDETTGAGSAIFARLDPRDPAISTYAPLVTARRTPTGGATIGAAVGEAYLFPEETSPGAHGVVPDLCPKRGLVVPYNTGIRVAQGTVASVGELVFTAEFEVINLGL